MQYSPLVERIAGEGAAAWEIHARALAAQAAGEDVIVLSVGDPDIPTPAGIVESAVAALRAGRTGYTDVVGEAELRAAIAARAGCQRGTPVGPEQVCVTAGAQNALFVAALLCFGRGDEVLVLDPAYVTYEATIRASGAEPVMVPPGPGFRPDPAALAAAVTPRTRGLMFSTPGNPTGVAMTADELAAIGRVAARHDLWVIADEVYGGLSFEAPHVPAASVPELAPHAVTVASLSKTHAMTGWRVGWLVGPQAMIHHAANLSLAMHYGLPGFVQQAAVTALEHADEVTAEMRAAYRGRRDALLDALSGVPGIAPLTPEAGMFVLADVSGTGLSSAEFAWELFRRERVSVLDGAAFGASAAGHVRISCTLGEDRLREAGARIARFSAGLGGAASAAAR